MIIVYISLAVVLVALIYLAFSAYKTFKDSKLALESLSVSTKLIQAKVNTIKSETDKLALTQQEISEDVQMKKAAVEYTIQAAKETPKPFKGIWKSVNGKPNMESQSRQDVLARRIN